MPERALNTVETNVTRTKLLKIDIQKELIYESCVWSGKRKKNLDLLPLRVCWKFMQTDKGIEYYSVIKNIKIYPVQVYD